LLDRARGKRKIALVSSGNRRGVAAILASVGWQDVFDIVISGDDVSRGKPDPEGYRMAAAALNSSRNGSIGRGTTRGTLMSDDIAAARSHPAFAGFSELLPLSGLSGAEVILMRTRAGSRVVRKMGRDAATNRVLKRQAERQRWLRTVIEDVADVPE
ncbi:hypothetical protein KXV85_004279, partial [Aspergillus fumigatus]